jgi:hypothetical protein
MKRLFFLLVLVFSLDSLVSQNTPIAHSENFVIGLPKVSQVQLNFIKGDLADLAKVKSAQFVFGDYVLLIETDANNLPYLSYSDIETILLKYFNQSDIYPKDHNKYYELKDELIKKDKYILK